MGRNRRRRYKLACLVSAVVLSIQTNAISSDIDGLSLYVGPDSAYGQWERPFNISAEGINAQPSRVRRFTTGLHLGFEQGMEQHWAYGFRYFRHNVDGLDVVYFEQSTDYASGVIVTKDGTLDGNLFMYGYMAGLRYNFWQWLEGSAYVGVISVKPYLEGAYQSTHTNISSGAVISSQKLMYEKDWNRGFWGYCGDLKVDAAIPVYKKISMLLGVGYSLLSMDVRRWSNDKTPFRFSAYVLSAGLRWTID